MLEIQKESLLFRGRMAALLEWNGWSDERLAKELGCCRQTVVAMRKSPASVGSDLTMKVMRMYRKKEQMLMS